MADNRRAYGLAKENGIDTSGMSPKEVWEALKEKGITPNASSKTEQAIDKYSDDPKRDKKAMQESGQLPNTQTDTLESVAKEINANPDNAQEIFKKAIDAGKVNLTVRQGAQNKHIPGTHEYEQEVAKGREPSVLTADAEELVKKYAGNGDIVISDAGQWEHKEKFTDDKDIGIYKNKRYNESAPTTRGKIHYSNKGTHIVPDNPKGKK